LQISSLRQPKGGGLPALEVGRGTNESSLEKEARYETLHGAAELKDYAVHVATHGEIRNAYKIFVGKSEGILG